MKVCLVALPWSMYRHPSAALGTLSAFLRQQEPGVEVETRSEFLEAALAIGIPLYDRISQSFALGELLYTALLFPERREHVRAYFAKTMEERDGPFEGAGGELIGASLRGPEPTWASAFDGVLGQLDAHLDRVVEAMAGRYALVGLTTCFGQLFANLAFSQRLARRSPGTRILLGGSTVSDKVGPSLLKEFDFLDYIIQGEGERPLAALVHQLREGNPDLTGLKGILSREGARANGARAELWEVGNMDDLPLPDYDEYAAKAEQANLLWLITIEGSRGCWWDRTKRTGNPKNTCYFCNLNVQWNGYRQKRSERVVSEVVALNERYANNVLFFLDNIIRAKGIEELAQGLIDTRKDFILFYEMRANVKPHELGLLHEAGLRFVQFGIESLSPTYLERIGKGTSVIANLQVMKLCHELGITNGANLLTHFPGGTAEEVEETRRNILEYALAYEPLSPNPFWLGRGSTLDALRKEYGLTNFRNADFYRVGLPEAVYERLELMDLSFDNPTEPADWSSVYQACKLWSGAYAAARATEYRHLLSYLDGGTSMRIFDARTGQLRNTVLRGLERDVYLDCLEIKKWEELKARFVDTGRTSASGLQAMLEGWNAMRLLYREGEKFEASRFLALAPAFTPQMASKRIREAHDTASRERTAQPPPAERAPAVA
ncbi:RiPP maturation radical SAM protein 1 [Corallococcus sp. ZKHCc1 1396]|uniref:RiPP maturation radical SAM protein 1 n=2 Tax=Myxococcaceae TaxID=31 RepID=A0ABR9PUZ1_9BACT|nr:RiPP maturation radical SAM protein 1 [Corallococcus soli]